MIKRTKDPIDPPPKWQKKRKPKWRDLYIKSRLQPTWKKLRKKQTWR